MTTGFTVVRSTPTTTVHRTGDRTVVDQIPAPTVVVAAANIGPRGPQGVTGPEGPIGPQGPSAADANHIHEQVVASAVWTITHALGAYPNVTVIDHLGDLCIGQLEYVDDQTMRITFSAALSGFAYIS